MWFDLGRVFLKRDLGGPRKTLAIGNGHSEQSEESSLINNF
jgi:hypothetical protein